MARDKKSPRPVRESTMVSDSQNLFGNFTIISNNITII